MNKIYVGAAYYPELWDENEADEDIKRCLSLGINCLRIGEFAWSKMEPREGEYDFVWLRRILDKLHAANINAVLCTPTCTPPRYLFDSYPDMRAVTPQGERTEIFSRCHVCKSSFNARKKNAQIVTAMAAEFGNHPAVIGWQIDNELFPYNHGCHCDNCTENFRRYLRSEFGDINNLNEAWCMRRWSLEYTDYSQIVPPRPDRWEHPSLSKAWWDFQCELICSYVKEQADILHKYTSAPIGTDMMQTNALSYYNVNKNLDVVQFNHYNPCEELPYTAFSYDFMRCVLDKPFWVTETQTGWNGSVYAEFGSRPQGNCYVNTWLPVARGANMNMYWLFRAQRSGHELMHGALYSTAGREYKVADEVRRAASDINKCGGFLLNTFVKSEVALHYSSTAVNAFDCVPVVKSFDYRKMLLKNYYAAMRGINVDVIDTAHGLNGYKVLLSPFAVTLEENGCRERIAEWVKSGGTWIVGPMSDIIDQNMSKYVNSPFSMLEEFAGVRLKYTVPAQNDRFAAKWRDGEDCAISTYYDAFELSGGTVSLADYADCELAPLCAVAERKVGKGRVIVLGGVIGERGTAKLLEYAGIKPIFDASDNIILTERSGAYNGVIVTEAENKAGYARLNGTYRELISGKTLSGEIEVKPHEVLVLKKV